MSETSPIDRARRVLWVMLDVDGVLTDGGLYYGESGESLKRFNALDGHGIKALQAMGVGFGILSGREHAAVSSRAHELGIMDVIQGAGDKLAALQAWRQGRAIPLESICHMGDDIPDLPVFRVVGFAATVPNAAKEVLAEAHWCADRPGGFGAVRSLCDLIAEARR